MSALPDSLPLWIALAVGLFWFVGAYNRLMRLRTAALQAYATLDATLMRQLEFVQARTAADESAVVAEAAAGLSSGTSLQAAAAQLGTLLAATRTRPLAPAHIAALGTAIQVLVSAWQRLHPDAAVLSFEADGTLSRPAPLAGSGEAPPLSASSPSSSPWPSAENAQPIAWPEPSAAAEIARGQFNLAVLHYNEAIRQFPALLVAWIMQLRPAAPLR